MTKWKDKVLKDQFGIPVAVVHHVPCYIFLGTQLYTTTYEMIKRSYPNRYRMKTFQKYHRKYYYKLMRRSKIKTNDETTFIVESSESPIKNFNKISIKRDSKNEGKGL